MTDLSNQTWTINPVFSGPTPPGPTLTIAFGAGQALPTPPLPPMGGLPKPVPCIGGSCQVTVPMVGAHAGTWASYNGEFTVWVPGAVTIAIAGNVSGSSGSGFLAMTGYFVPVTYTLNS